MLNSIWNHGIFVTYTHTHSLTVRCFSIFVEYLLNYLHLLFRRFVDFFIRSYEYVRVANTHRTAHQVHSQLRPAFTYENTTTKIERKLLVCIWRWRRLGRFLSHILNSKKQSYKWKQSPASASSSMFALIADWTNNNIILLSIDSMRDAPFHHLWRIKWTVNRSMIASSDNWMNKLSCNWFILTFFKLKYDAEGVQYPPVNYQFRQNRWTQHT